MVGIHAENGRQTGFRIGKTIIAGRTFRQQSKAVFWLVYAELSGFSLPPRRRCSCA
jgi:hypothetical protein